MSCKNLSSKWGQPGGFAGPIFVPAPSTRAAGPARDNFSYRARIDGWNGGFFKYFIPTFSHSKSFTNTILRILIKLTKLIHA
ncbi:unnamed protein product [Nesidiocoris tenuis]|uniref:Uncharacterized protein n=1 Tax=Nesidiocoris tenuis TaxID=355587 RepID=A0A6H5G9R0_9HEMI|nr:unnamed protein product [Nesidiocoris tenuis]